MKRLHLFCFVVLVSLTSSIALAYTSQDCIECHRKDSTVSALRISVKEFEDSIHGREITCQDCHSEVKDETHEKMNGSGVVVCGQCHEQENKHGLSLKITIRPQCHSCHTKHGIYEKNKVVSTVHPGRLRKTCKGCHPIECGETKYLSWLPSIQISSHNKQNFSREYDKGNCLGCHQGRAAHGDKTLLNDQDCAKCHLTAKGQSKLLGYFHPRADFKKQPTIYAAAMIYQLFIVALLWGGFRFYTRKFSGNPKGKRLRK